MSELTFDCIDVQPEQYAAGPNLTFRFRVTETTGTQIHAIGLRCQMRIEPTKRRYTPEEEDHLQDLFGATSRWGETLNPIQFANISIMIPGFSGATEIDVPVPCTYDMEVTSAKYFHSLRSGEIPLLMLFSGTVFTKGETGFSVEQVPWHKETSYRLPVRVWTELMNLHFPNSAWIRLRTDTLDDLRRFTTSRALPNWDQAIEMLLKKQDDQP